MRIGIPRETKPGERRVGLTPQAVAALVARGHAVLVERGAGSGIGASDGDYERAGARNVERAQAWGCELVVKVKEIQPEEVEGLQPGTTLFGYQHLAGEPDLTRDVAARSVNAIAYEMVRDERGSYPLLAPMSQIAGGMAADIAADLLGAPPARVLVLGAGHAGSSAARRAREMGAHVTMLRRADATPAAIEAAAMDADLVVGAVFVPATPTPKLLPRTLVRRMKRGAVIVDISIDAGGVAETSRPTSHAHPTFVAEGVIHYCVGNMPAADPAAASEALSAATLPYVLELAHKGIERAVRENPALAAGVAIWQGVPAAVLAA